MDNLVALICIFDTFDIICVLDVLLLFCGICFPSLSRLLLLSFMLIELDGSREFQLKSFKFLDYEEGFNVSIDN